MEELARPLARGDSLQLRKDGLKYTVKVQGQITMEVEVESGDDRSKLEIEISW